MFDQNINKDKKACFFKAKIYLSQMNLVFFINTTQFHHTERL